MSAPLRIAPFIGGLLFIVLALGIALPPLFDVFSDPDIDTAGGDVAVVLMVLFFAAAPAFVGVRLIQRATRGEPGAVAATPQMAPAHAVASGATTARPGDQPPVALTPSYDAALPPPPSVRRERQAELAAAEGLAQAKSWTDRLRAPAQSSLGLAMVVALVTIPLMVVIGTGGAYVATLALMIFAIAEIGRSAVGRSWFIPALTSAGTGMMLFIVLGATAGALEQGEGNNPVLILPGMLFYGGTALTGLVRWFSRR